MQAQSFNGKSMKKPPQRFNPFYRESGHKKTAPRMRGGVSEVLLLLWRALHAEVAPIGISGIDGKVVGRIIPAHRSAIVAPALYIGGDLGLMAVAAVRQIGNNELAAIGRDCEQGGMRARLDLRAGEPRERLILGEIGTRQIVGGAGA